MRIFNKSVSTPLMKNGISLAVDFRGINGLAQVGRDFIDKIERLPVKFDLVALKSARNGLLTEKEYNKYLKISSASGYQKKITFSTREYKKETVFDNTAVIFWEFESGMLDARPKLFKGLKSVLALSDFCYNYLKTVAPDNVEIIKIRYPFIENWIITRSPDQIRDEFGIKRDDFILYFNFDYRSSYFRKNPEGILKAFAESLGKKNNARLIIKTSGFNNHPENVKRLNNYVKRLNIQDKVIFINKYLSRDEIMTILNACDGYISLHRGEGLGIGMLEAMALNKPVIATNYGGNTEFCNHDNCLLVDYKLVKPEKIDKSTYKGVKLWAEPDIEAAAAYIEKIYNDKKLCAILGEKARKFIYSYYSDENFYKDLQNLLV